MIDNVLSGTMCLFCFSALFSNIYRKINFMAKKKKKKKKKEKKKKKKVCLSNFYCKLDF